ncbi:hypothetical protein H6F67_14600 [Microcoleus sp. FACHB-1515]|uniref:hypothetical protein n=1 Tax=Cyanophyceae TaxID=3028117 RepID=UPI00168444C6|nr:hypothetical protein [Microcoleus sp. FACHB-1515]MBD2091081.1 hypothetical protein [Microcoleus sp. FACHB-1515]
MNNDNLSRRDRRDSRPLIQIPSAVRFRDDRRHPIKHLLIGSPEAVQITQQTLEILRYADLRDWALPLPLGEPFKVAPAPGDVISTLIRYLAIE